MVFTMHFFKFKLRAPLLCAMTLLIAESFCLGSLFNSASFTGSGALAENSEIEGMPVDPRHEVPPVMDKSGTAKMFLRGGELEAERSNWEAAVEKFQEALKLDRDCALAHYDLGVAQFHLGQLELAAQAEKRAIVLDPKLIDAYIQLASILSRLADYSGAEEILERALKMDEHCQIARESLNEICRLKKSKPSLFREHEADSDTSNKHGDNSVEPTVQQTKLKHSS
jgi:tetratricopeptide (TPR) repeat protein